MNQQYFTEQIKKTEQSLKQKNSRLAQLGFYRVITFIISLFGFICGITDGSIIGFLLGFISLTGFIALVGSYNRMQQSVDYDKTQKEVLGRYLKRLDEDEKGWRSFEDNGSDYLTEKDTRSKDLDLLGRSSLYQYLSVCATPYGKRGLAAALSQGCEDKEKILKRQEAVKELIEEEGFSIHLQTLLAQMNGKNGLKDEAVLNSFIAEAKKHERYVGKTMRILSIVIPALAIFSAILAFNHIYTVIFYSIMSICIVMMLGISFFQYGQSSSLLGPVYEFIKKLDMYKAILKALQEKEFKSSYLKELQAELLKNGGAVKGLNSLNRLNIAIDVRYNAMLYIVVAAFLLWDVQCKIALEKWSMEYGTQIENWLKVVGEIEVLLSLAVMGQVREHYCFPEITDTQEPQIAFKHLVHPLIKQEKAVSNSFSLRSSTCIITGSNMSGKTTFLRSIGISLSLAYAGGVVAAESFMAAKMQVFTSMRVEDRVDEGISTFYAELLRIKEMITYSQTKKPMIALIDEIFKGTNSKDRILGARQTIQKLSQPWVNVMVSTHDFELCSLPSTKERTIVNYHFEEHYKDNRILFDYQLKSGRCETTNAQYLLKMVGILDAK